MELVFVSGPAAVKKDSILKFGDLQKHIASSILLLFLIGCGRIGSNQDSDKAATIGKDSHAVENFETERKAARTQGIPLGTEVDGAEHEHGNHSVVDEVVVQQWPLHAILNYGDADVFHEIRDKYGNLPTDPNERLYAANHYQPPIGFLSPIKTPDGHHVTLSEWRTAKGTLMVHCNGLNSTVEIVLEGMIPNGVYTTWLGYLNKSKKPGDPLNFGQDFVYRTNPPLGDPSGADNVLIADIDGNIDAIIEHPGCILAGAVALGMPILYHINGKTYGGGTIPDREEVTQLLIYFQ